MKDACFSRLVGLIPAAGTATRISPLPCSKELYPIGFHSVGESRDLRPKVISHYLFDALRLAGVTEVFVILREGKWDIPAYFRDGGRIGVNLAYLVVPPTTGVPFTLDYAYPFMRDATVLLGFPDILFSPEDAFEKILIRMRGSKSHIFLGLFPAHNPQKVDLVELESDGRVKRLHIKPKGSSLKYTWSVAVWTPAFTEFIHNYVSSHSKGGDGKSKELFVGNVIQAAIENGIAAETVVFGEGKSLDIGTPDDLLLALRRELESVH